MSKVYFVKDKHLQKIGTALHKFPLEKWSGKRVAVKMHMGEYGNLNYIRPVIAGKIVEVLKAAGAKPLLFDSPTLYKTKRHTVSDYVDTARRNGFTPETIGCPIVISNESVQKNGKLFNVGVCREIAEAGAMLVLTHAKGHFCTGLGGAVKNIGMGCVDIATKKLEHDKANMVVNLEKCIGCGDCARACPFDAVTVEEGKAVIDCEHCWGCAKCFKACRQKALSPKELMPDVTIASAALAVLQCFDKTDLLYVNALLSIGPNCDCDKNAPLAAMPDIGFLVSGNILAIDRASAELINKRFGSDWFDSLGFRDPLQQVKWIEGQGYGKSDFELEEI